MSTKHDNRAHARLAPSASARWLRCPSSVKVIEILMERGKIPRREENAASREGTEAHEQAEVAIKTGKRADDKDVQGYVDYVDEIVSTLELAGYDVDKQIEARMNAEFESVNGRKETIFGSVDCLIIAQGDGLTPQVHVIDLKFGRGVPVSPEKNYQLSIYALLAVKSGLVPEDVAANAEFHLHIYQPRNKQGGGVWQTDRQWLACVEGMISAVIDHTYHINARVASEKACQWCRAKPYCKVAQKAAEEIVFDDFGLQPQTESHPLERMTLADMAEFYKKTKFVVELREAVEAEIKEHAPEGEEIGGLKVVEAQGRWVVNKNMIGQLAHALGKQAFREVPVAPSEIIRLCEEKGEDYTQFLKRSKTSKKIVDTES